MEFVADVASTKFIFISFKKLLLLFSLKLSYYLLTFLDLSVIPSVILPNVDTIKALMSL